MPRCCLIYSKIVVREILNRKQAIKTALLNSQPKDVVVLAGKGEDPYQKIKGADVFYAGDVNIAKAIIEEHEKK